MTVASEELGPFLTEAGRTAFSSVQSTLQRRPGMWVILANVCLDAPTDDYHERLHIVVVGPPGVSVCEVRRGDDGFIQGTTEFLQVAALRAHQKADRLSRCLTAADITVPVKPILALHTTDTSGAPSTSFGVPILSSTQLGSDLGRGDTTLTAAQIVRIVTTIRADHNRHDQAINLGIARNLVVDDATGAPFHVTYRARIANDQPIVVHLHDLTAGNREDALRVAQRGYEVLADLAPNPSIPPIVERLAPHPANDGDLAWFAVGDDNFRSLAEAAADPDWNIVYRVRFAAQALSVLAALHRPTEVDIEGLVLRDISPTTVRIALDNQPYFSRFRFARYVGRATIAPIAGPQWQPDEFTAPEVRDGGLSDATAASDVFSLCASLITVLDVPRAHDEPESRLAPLAREILAAGCTRVPRNRPTPILLAQSLDSLFDDDRETDPDPVPIRTGPVDGYDVVRPLGHGGFGSTFLVRERQDDADPFPPAEDESDCLVAKMPHDHERATRTIRGHRLARPYSDRDASLATVLHVAGREWEPGVPAALISFVQGSTLTSASASLRASHRGTTGFAHTCLVWYAQTLRSLTYLHPRLVHGDVSPDNILLTNSANVLVDYDTVTPPGNIYRGERTEFASHQRRQGARATCAEDVFACAATIFACLFGVDFPFKHAGRDNPREGLAWPTTVPHEATHDFTTLRAVLDRATRPDPAMRYRDAHDALADLSERLPSDRDLMSLLRPVTPRPDWGRSPMSPRMPGPTLDAHGDDHQPPVRPAVPSSPVPESMRAPDERVPVPQTIAAMFPRIASVRDYNDYFDQVVRFLRTTNQERIES